MLDFWGLWYICLTKPFLLELLFNDNKINSFSLLNKNNKYDEIKNNFIKEVEKNKLISYIKKTKLDVR